MAQEIGEKPVPAFSSPALIIVTKAANALRLTAVDRRAAEAGLAPGLTLADARARVHGLAVAEADPRADARLLHRLALYAGRYTPLVTPSGADGLTLDITGCAHLFGGEAGLVRDFCKRIRGFGFSTRAAIAGTPEAAQALARFGAQVLVSPGDEARHIAPLPLVALSVARETIVALSRAGFRTLGDLADRPSTVLAARFGVDLVTRLGRLYAREDVRITPLRSPPDLLVDRHFAEPVTRMEMLEIVLHKLGLSLCETLAARGMGGRRFEATFFRSDGAVRRLRIDTGQPVRDIAVILRLFRLRLVTLTDPLDPGFGFDALRLAVPVAEPMGEVQRDLGGGGAEGVALATLLDGFAVRLGADAVIRFVAGNSHSPEREGRSVPVAAPVDVKPWPEPEPDAPPTRPLSLFVPPQPIETLAEVPDGPPLRFRWRRVLHEIARAEGPERIAPEWWTTGSEMQARDYYRVEDGEGRRFWVFREGMYGVGHPRWFMHGLFA